MILSLIEVLELANWSHLEYDFNHVIKFGGDAMDIS